MNSGIWFVYAAAAFVLLLALFSIFGDWHNRRRQRRAH